MLGLYLILRNIPMPRGQTPAPLNKFKAPPPPRVRSFLDHVGACVESRQCRILLNEKYLPLLSPRSTALNAALVAFVESLPEDAKRAGPFKPVLEMLLKLGLRTETLRRLLDNDELEGPYRQQIRQVLRRKP